MSFDSRKLVYSFSNLLRRLGHDFNELSDPRVRNMRDTIAGLDNKAINFTVEDYPDGSWVAESINVDGIMTGSNDKSEMRDLIMDAVFTYFEIPPHLCKSELLRPDNEPVKVKRKVYVGA